MPFESEAAQSGRVIIEHKSVIVPARLKRLEIRAAVSRQPTRRPRRGEKPIIISVGLETAAPAHMLLRRPEEQAPRGVR